MINNSPEASIFVAIPSYDNWIHTDCITGLLQAHKVFAGRIASDVLRGAHVGNNRNQLSHRFLDSGASHMLCLDTDVGWRPEQLQALLDADRDVVSGVYCKKQDDREIPAKFTGITDGHLRECEWVPGGFLLVKRAVIERMHGAYAKLGYAKDGRRYVGIWNMIGASGEDCSFCARWRQIGGKVWMRMDVRLKHYGEYGFEPTSDQGSS